MFSPLVGLNITIQPSDILTRSGVVASFECIAEGSVNISYQWQKLNDTLDGIPGGPAGSGSGSGDGLMGYVDVENAINSTLEFNPVMFGDEGAYRCIVSGTLISNIALLTGMWKHLKASYIYIQQKFIDGALRGQQPEPVAIHYQ